jgi:tetratricopeptide (TPR) repeat protein
LEKKVNRPGVIIMKSRPVSWFLTLFLLAPWITYFAFCQEAKVIIWEEQLTIPTYEIGEEDPNPPLWNKRVYPYPMQDYLPGIKKDKTYEAVYLENQYLKLIVLPELGGHLYAAYDKLGKRDFIYRNNVIKPGLVGLRGAWVSGGIEFNFPEGHIVTTVSHVDHALRSNPDGSATVWVSNIERVSRMKWSVGITLFPDRAYVETHTVLFNRTLFHNRFYFWANAAIPAAEDLQFIYPARIGTDHSKATPYRWPMDKGVDISWYKNVDHAMSFFGVGVEDDFFGAYYHEQDWGIVHVANHHEDAGKKLWTWGTARDGMIWEKILTDSDGQYCEIQSGRFENQSDFGFLEPHNVEEWKEYWYPVRQMGAFIYANKDAAFDFDVSADDDSQDVKITMAVNVTTPFPDAQLAVDLDGQRVYTKSVRLSPDRPFSDEFRPKLADGQWKLAVMTLYSSDGKTILTFSRKRQEEPVSEFRVTSPKPELDMTAEELYLKGEFHEKTGDPIEARRLNEKALERDSGYAPAQCALGIMDFRTGEYDKALERFNFSLERNDGYAKARFYRASLQKLMGTRDGIFPATVTDDLWRLRREKPYAPIADYQLGEISLIKGKYADAEAYFASSIVGNPNDTKSLGMLAIAKRLQKKTDEAETILQEILNRDPTDHLAHAEMFLLAKQESAKEKSDSSLQELRALLRGEPQSYLELATDYGNVRLYDCAIAVLEMVAKARQEKSIDPMIYYYMGYNLERKGDTKGALEKYSLGAQMSPSYVFPHRLESFDVLRSVLRTNPNDARAHYYLGNLLCSRGQIEQAVREWEKSLQMDDNFSVVHRNLGQVYWHAKDDLTSATKHYEHAIEKNRRDFRLYGDLDMLYAAKGQHEKRLRLVLSAPEEVRRNLNILLRESILYVDLEMFDKALEILDSNTFAPWEGWQGAHNVYVEAHFGRGEKYLAEGEYKKAAKDLLATADYPENLGSGQPAKTSNAKAFFLLGRCYKEVGESNKAREYWQRASEEQHPFWSEYHIYSVASSGKLGEVKKATQEIDRLVDHGESAIKKDSSAWNFYLLGLACKAKSEISLSGNSSRRQQLQKARRAFEDALGKDGSLKQAKRALQSLVKGEM